MDTEEGDLDLWLLTKQAWEALLNLNMTDEETENLQSD